MPAQHPELPCSGTSPAHSFSLSRYRLSAQKILQSIHRSETSCGEAELEFRTRMLGRTSQERRACPDKHTFEALAVGFNFGHQAPHFTQKELHESCERYQSVPRRLESKVSI